MAVRIAKTMAATGGPGHRRLPRARFREIGRRTVAAAATVAVVAGVQTGLPATPAGASLGTNVVPGVATGAATHTAGAPDYRTVVQTLKRQVPQIMAQHGAVGTTVALVDGDRTILAKGFGWADRARRRPVTSRTLFHIGSLSKTFTAAAVMQLVEQGRVDLDAPLSRYVPELRMQPRFRRNTITVRSVLDHHSGIPGDLLHGMITLGKPDPSFHDELLRTLGRMPPERPVDTGWAYSNSAFVLLQLLVEHVTGQPYATRTARTLFRRMDMPSSTFDDTRVPGRKLTRNYVPVLDADGNPTGRATVSPREYLNGWTAGSVLSSARDMARYLRMLVNRGRGVNGRVVRPQTLRRMMTAQTDLPIDFGLEIGIAWLRRDSWMGKLAWHNGATTRNFSMALVHPGQRLGVFVSTNTANGYLTSDAVADLAMGLLYTAKTGRQQPPPPVLPDPGPGTPSAAELAAAQGRYAGNTSYTDVTAVGQQLRLTTLGPGKPTSARYTALADGWWESAAVPQQQVAFRTVADRRLLVSRSPGDVSITTAVVGQRVATRPPPRAWRLAVGRYRARIDPTHRIDAIPLELRLHVRDGLAVLVYRTGTPPISNRQVLRPTAGDRAFTFGWSPSGGRGKGDLVRRVGARLVFMGVAYRRVE